MDMSWMPGMWMPGFMLMGGFLWLAVLVAAGAGVWWLIRQPRSAPRDSALEILRERYARGEISREEFEARRRDLVA